MKEAALIKWLKAKHAARRQNCIDYYEGRLVAMTAERDEWQVKARWKHTHDDSLELELQDRLAEIETKAKALCCQNGALLIENQDLTQQLAASQARCAQLEEALKFYADEKNWVGNLVDIGVGNLEEPNSSEVAMDHGMKANQALTSTERPTT